MRNEVIERAAAIVGGPSKLAGIAGVKPPTVQQWLNNERPVPAARCSAIEAATGGQVTRRDLRPSDWHLLWPELVQSEAQPAS